MPSCQKADRDESRKISLCLQFGRNSRARLAARRAGSPHPKRPFKTRGGGMQFPRRSTTAVTIGLGGLTWLAAADARAQDLPSRIIRVGVAFPAGGPTDFVARLLADRLKPLLGQNVIVENRPGANGAIGADYVAKGEADGHLLFLTTVGAVTVTPHLSKPNYDTL